jgi:acyl-CoA synthetase (AMP-forming)/AMP-acid ligase II
MDATRPATIDPRKAVAQIRQFNVTNLFGSSAVIRRLGEWCSDNGVSLPTLRRAISAGAPASIPAIERFAKLLPESAQVFTPYGATEALPVANIGSREILSETRPLTEQGKGVCVGRPVPGVEVRVIAIRDEPIAEWDESLCVPPGQVGEFVVRGPVVTRQYFNRSEATKLAKIRDPRTGDVLHRMGDVGYLDEHGRLWFCGRKSHRVVTPHGTLFTDMVEPVFNTVEGVHRTALVGVTRDGVTYPVLCVEPKKLYPRSVNNGILPGGAWDPKAIESELRVIGGKFPHTQSINTFLIYDRAGGFPVDVRHNSKIFREKLARWADRTLGKRWNPKAHGRQSVSSEVPQS